MALRPENFVGHCRCCGNLVSLLDARVDKAYCGPACKQKFYRKLQTVKSAKENHQNASEHVTLHVEQEDCPSAYEHPSIRRPPAHLVP